MTTNIEETLNEFPLEGDVQLPQQRFHDFSSFKEMMDFAQAFNIHAAQYGKMNNGKFRLIYNTSEN